MEGSRNIRIFKDWFGFDKRAKEEERRVCEAAAGKIAPKKDSGWHWTSDFKGFWIEGHKPYFKYLCDKCNDSFFLPVSDANNCIVCGEVAAKVETYSSGRIAALGENVPMGANKEYFDKMAKEDVAQTHEDKLSVDWDHLRENL